MSSNVIEGNKLIAVFDGWFQDPKLNKNGNVNWRHPERAKYFPTTESSFKYHTSWDWLMPVVKKWNDLVVEKRNEGGVGWTKWQYKTIMLRTEIEPLYKDLVESLQWYNQTQTHAEQ